MSAARFADSDRFMWASPAPNPTRHNARGWYYANCTLPWDDDQRPSPMFMRNTGWPMAAAGGPPGALDPVALTEYVRSAGDQSWLTATSIPHAQAVTIGPGGWVVDGDGHMLGRADPETGHIVLDGTGIVVGIVDTATLAHLRDEAT